MPELQALPVSPWLYGGFLSFVAIVLALDLGVFHRRAHAPTFRESAAWTAVWTTLALGFGAFVGSRFGATAAIDYYTAWLVEQSLSIDNIFVFVVVFAGMRIPPHLQHRVLFWGVLSAVVLRAAMIFGGVYLITRFHWILHLFGAFLLVTAWRLVRRSPHAAPDETESRILCWLRRHVRVTEQLHGTHFFVRQDGRLRGTPLLLTLVLIELTDVVFAVDSIPAVFAVTTDPFLVFTSNIFAILGLRSLYFLLAGLADRFVYLKPALGIVLAFVGTKLLLHDTVKIPSAVSLAVIVVVLAAGVVLSLRREARTQPRAP